MPTFGESYTETTVSAVHTWRNTVSGPYLLDGQGACRDGEDGATAASVVLVPLLQWSGLG